MKRFTLCMACVAILASVAEARTWTSARGKTIDAEFVSIDRDGVVLKNTAGKLYRVPYNKLSQADQIAAYGLAVDKATTMIETNPKNGKAFSMRALAYSKQGEYDKAMDDFGRAVRYSPDDPSALKNRGDALMDLHKGKNAKLRAYAEKFKEKERKKTSAVHKKYIGDRRLIAQPENSTTGDVFPGLYAMAQADFKAAKRLRYRGYGINGGGYGIGYGGGGGYGGGVGVGYGVGYGKGKGIAADQGVMVFPEQAPQGTELTLVANAKQLSNGMPYKIDPETGRRAKGKKGQRYGTKEDIEGVEFYRDVNGNGKLDGDDLKIGEDTDGETNGQYTAKVSSDLFPVGTQSYFAVPKGAEGTDKKAYKSKASDEDKKAKAQGKPAAGQGEITPGSPAVAKAPGKGGPGKGGEGDGDGDGGGSDDGGNGGDGDRDYDGDDNDTVVIRDRDNDGRDVVYIDDDDDALIVIDDDDDRDLVVDRNVRYIEDGDYNGAIRGYTQVIDYKNDDPRYYVGRANAYRAVGDYSSAIVDYDAAIKLQPKNADFYYNRGLAYRNEGKLDLAIADYLKSISLDETLSKAYNNLASVYGVKGDYESAVKYATIAVERNSSDALAFFNRGLAYFKMGEHDKAIKDLSVVINLTPNDPFAYAYRSQSYGKIGETTKARADMVKAKALSPVLGG
jgi:tetratricopeptide (TPR) repeat protein